jgi:squalene-associated FAD-dependent desaturase
MPSQSVLVIGGGLAGLSSAVALAEAGFQIHLLEKRPHLGGRATSYTLADGSEVDNCQHVTLGCCTNLADFYRRVGVEDKVRFYDRLYFVDRTGKRSTIESSWLPPPLHMAPSFLQFGALSFADKRAIAIALLAVARAGGSPPGIEGVSMLDWLHRMKQPPSAIERYWRVVLVSALDEELARMDASYGIEVFWKAFLGSRGGFRVGIPTVPLADLYDGGKEAVEKRGGEVRLRCGVRDIQIDSGRFGGVVLDDGTVLTADACIAAVQQDVLRNLLPKEMPETGHVLEGLPHLENSPITSAHFWFDRPVMREPFLTLLDHTTQWVFNKSALLEDSAQQNGNTRSGAKGQYLQMVISASYDLVPRSRQEIIEMCRKELAEVLPETKSADLLKATVIKEVNATFSPAPGVDRWRPRQSIGIPNFFLAGDWTRTGWPATMESAVRSGYLAAEAVSAAAGRDDRFLRPDLPFEGLSKVWAKRARKAAAGEE